MDIVKRKGGIELVKTKISYPGVYIFKNLINNTVYVGQTLNMNRRKNDHFRDLKNNKHRNKNLQRDYNMYKKNNFIFIPLIICEKDELTKYEQYFIDFYKDNRYNKIPFAGLVGRKGVKWSNEEKEKMGKSKIGNKNCIGKKNALGYKHTLEERKKRSERMKGNTFGKYTKKYNNFIDIWIELRRNKVPYWKIALDYKVNRNTVAKYIKEKKEERESINV